MAIVTTSMVVVSNYTLDMTPGSIPTIIHVSQNDTNRALVLQLVNENGVLNLPTSNYQIGVHGVKPDGTSFDENGSDYIELNSTDATVTMILTNDMTSVAGHVVCEIYIKNTYYNRQIATANFVIAVEAKPTERSVLMPIV